MTELDLAECVAELPPPADYFPIDTGRYEVHPGLKILGQQPVQGKIETNFLMIDGQYYAYLRAKRAARQECLNKYYRTHDLTDALARSVALWLMERMAGEYPAYFEATETQPGLWSFTNRLVGLTARLDLVCLRVQSTEPSEPLVPGGGVYADVDFVGADPVDFLVSQLQEDFAITSVEPEARHNWLSLLHLSFPNHWSPAEKIGQTFMAVHEPVADFEKVARGSDKLIEAMIHRGPFVRFAWGISTDTTLNHHPENPPGRALDRYEPEAAGEGTYMRIERQTLKGFPEHHAAVFTIRTYFTPVSAVAADPERRAQLRSAIATMSPDALRYKGLEKIQAPLVDYLS